MNKIFQQKFGSNCGEYDVLGTINWCTSEDGHITPGKLADTIILSSPAMTNRVDRLEAKGLIYRDRDITDRRLVLIGLTPEGRKMAREMDAIYDQFLIYHVTNCNITLNTARLIFNRVEGATGFIISRKARSRNQTIRFLV